MSWMGNAILFTKKIEGRKERKKERKKDTQLVIFIFLKLKGNMACAALEPLIIVKRLDAVFVLVVYH